MFRAHACCTISAIFVNSYACKFLVKNSLFQIGKPQLLSLLQMGSEIAPNAERENRPGIPTFLSRRTVERAKARAPLLISTSFDRPTTNSEVIDDLCKVVVPEN